MDKPICENCKNFQKAPEGALKTIWKMMSNEEGQMVPGRFRTGEPFALNEGECLLNKPTIDGFPIMHNSDSCHEFQLRVM